MTGAAAPSIWRCDSCGSETSAEARFCSACGVALQASGDSVVRVSVTAGEPGPGPLAVAVAERRVLGLPASWSLLGAGVAAAVLALVAFALGHWILGLVLLALACALVWAFAALAERQPEVAAARWSAVAVDAIGGWAGFARGAAGAWTQAGAEIMQVRRQLLELANRRRQAVIELGAAAYADDAEGMQTLRERLQQIDGDLATLEQRLAGATDRARLRVRRERLAVQPTERIDLSELPGNALSAEASPSDTPPVTPDR